MAKRTFFLKAPGARVVELKGEWAKTNIPLLPDGAGRWSVDLAALPAGVWTYSFLVDGLNVLDPSNPEVNPEYFGVKKNILHLPASPPAPWDWQNVPHGVLHTHAYESKALGQRRHLVVYTPAGYGAKPARLYPLLVLQHGFGGSRGSWVAHGRANLILDNLIAAGHAKPMVVVMLDGHSGNSQQAQDSSGVEAFRQELLSDAIPLVEREYRLAGNPGARALFGLSMGAKQATTVGLGSLDLFGWVGGFSAIAYPGPEILDRLVEAPERAQSLKLLWLAWGRDDARAVSAGEPFLEQLRKTRIRYQWKVVDGGHEWAVWQRCLVDLLPKLF
ncbi:MAG: hypothetical protein J0L75_03845 [Spirochaetes bacterium]|nr:hypothetical protein [Spirochaetota bacterium]